MTDSAKATPRTLLAQKRAEAIARTQAIVLPVPNYDDFYIKFRAISVDEVKKANDGVKKLPEGLQPYEANARLLANACLGIYQKLEDGKYESILGPDTAAPTFNYEFAKELVEPQDLPDERKLTAAAIVKMFYATDLDVISTGDALAKASGARQIEAEQDFTEA